MKPVALALLALSLFACAKKPLPTLEEKKAPISTPKEEEETVPDSDETLVALEEIPAPTWTIFFDYNSSALREAYKAAALADYMLKTTKVVLLSGHASQEGEDAYNLALGARRAVAVRSYLEAAGIPENRISWRSFGEEKPVTEDPAKYALNRRVEITLEDPQ
jgi:outer membrane protein OmpA-like peptidoglycan-associated protein